MEDIYDFLDSAKLVQKGFEENNKIKTSKPKNTKILPKLTIYITRRGGFINLNEIDGKTIKIIKNYFTISNKNIMGYIEKTSNYYIKKDKLYIPRFGTYLLHKKFNITIINLITFSEHNPTNPIEPDNKWAWSGAYKNNQQLVADHIQDTYFSDEAISEGQSGVILNLEAGQGKTFVAMGLVSDIKRRTLIVTHNTTILFQWVKLLGEFFPGLKIGVYYSKTKTEGDIIVGVINSLVMDDIIFNEKDPITKKKIEKKYTPKDFYKTFDFVIFDECHEYCSASRNKIFRVCQRTYMLGLSATPNERIDKLDSIPRWNIGEILDAKTILNYTEDDIPFKGKVHMIKYLGPPQFTENLINEKLEIISIPLIMDQITQDPYRIQIIIDEIMNLINGEYYILVFADRISYLEKLKDALMVRLTGQDTINAPIGVEDDVKDTVAPGDELNANQLNLIHFLTNIEEENRIMQIVGGCKTENLDKAKNKANIILTTYQYMGTGCSIPKLNSIILATPRKTKSRQFINRIFRLGSNYDIERQIIDIVDWKLTLKNQWYHRKKYYEEKEYPIEEKIIKYSDINL